MDFEPADKNSGAGVFIAEQFKSLHLIFFFFFTLTYMCVCVSAYVVGRGEGSDPAADVPVLSPLICGVNDVSGLKWPLLLSVSQRLS